MFEKSLSRKIEEILLNSSKEYFHKNLSNISFPEDAKVFLQFIRDSEHGDFASNIAMRLAKAGGCSPLEIGEGIIAIFHKKIESTDLSGLISEIQLKNGFINFYLSSEYYKNLLTLIKSQGANFGKNSEGHSASINLEFVSANPTGPLTIAHGRQAAIGDALSRILRFNGYKVTCEYYLNDIGRQISILGKSTEIRYRNLCGVQEAMPEDSYIGDYIIDIAGEIKRKKGTRLLSGGEKASLFFRDYAVWYIMRTIIKDLNDFGVRFDVWTSQKKMEERKEVETTLKLLEEKGYIAEKEDAKWFLSTKFGDDKDRVVVKSDGSYTYVAPDIAYHLDKYKRGYSRLIDLLGPDHHGYINRMKAAVQALGRNRDSLDILIVQLVTLFRNGQAVSMSTRRAEFITLREIIDEIGKDVARFFFLSRRLDSHLDFDIELAKKESQDNPVYYIQYAHARICSIKRYSQKIKWRLFFTKPNLGLLTTIQEKELIRKLSEFPFVVKASNDALEPNRLVVYLNDLARLFHSFYTECRVVSDDMALSNARLFLVECVRIVLANGLGLLNITLPERM